MQDAPKGNFRRHDTHQTLLLLPNLQDRLPEDHIARFLSDVVDNEVDLTPFLQGYDN